MQAQLGAQRERIVAAARKLFLRDGVDAVSMRNLAAEVGCSPMALYRYFANKQELLAQVWDVFLGELFARLEKIHAASPHARLEKLALAYLAYWLEHPERYLIVFLQKDLVAGATRDYLATSPLVERFELFTRVVRDAQAEGEFSDLEAAAVARGLLCVLQGLALNFITLPEYPWGEVSALSTQTLRAYLAGVGAMSKAPGPVKGRSRRS
ncbi:MAG: TetR/AcrR family transcriptional regulator [Panacagrimonas sp.]